MKAGAGAILLLVLMALAGCLPAGPSAVPEPTSTLEPWEMPQPDGSRATVIGAVRPIATPGPSPTPWVHVIREGDTLLGIALEYGVDLNDLLLANPGVNPRFLTLGQQLVVPGPGGEPAAGLLPTPTPIPVFLSAVGCYPMFEAALRCLTTASSRSAVEGLVALITLVSADGEAMRTELAFSPINLLNPGEVLPLVAVFDPPIPEFSQATAEMVSAVPANDIGERYAALEWVVDETVVSDSGEVWSISGRLMAQGEQAQETFAATLLLLALNPDDEVVGYRSEEIEVKDEAAFKLAIRTLGPAVVGVNVLAEAVLLP